MAAIKVKFRESRIKGREGTIYYQITHRGETILLNTTYKIFSSEWNKDIGGVSIDGSLGFDRIIILNKIADNINKDLNRLYNIIAEVRSRREQFRCEEIIAIYRKQMNGITLFRYMINIIEQLNRHHKLRTCEAYKATYNSFKRYRKGVDILLCDINTTVIMDYQAHLKISGASLNTISFYMRILRSVFNRAIDLNLIMYSTPFKQAYTGVDRTMKRDISINSLKKIKSLSLKKRPSVDLARDLFLMSFYLRGMAFVDMAYLRKSDLKSNIITYRRRKTGQLLTIKWEKCMQRVVNKYPDNKTEYLLPIIVNPNINPHVQYKNALSLTNKSLKYIGKIINEPTTLTIYVARHTWANVARSNNVPISVISESMGHVTERTTQIYLSSLDSSIIDKANNKILKMLD